MRLDKYLSNSTDLSRKEVRCLIKLGEVSLNSEQVFNPSLQVIPTDLVELSGRKIQQSGHRYLMLNKPLGVVCSNKDELHPVVSSLIDLPRAQELFICGRLDIDTTGLVLLTDDGQWAHRISSPKHKRDKCYEVITVDPVSLDAIAKFNRGIMLKGETKRTAPAQLVLITSTRVNVVLTEGRYHQVKRMFAALGNRVVGLHRSRIGEVELGSELELGAYRFLTDKEVESFYD